MKIIQVIQMKTFGNFKHLSRLFKEFHILCHLRFSFSKDTASTYNTVIAPCNIHLRWLILNPRIQNSSLSSFCHLWSNISLCYWPTIGLPINAPSFLINHNHNHTWACNWANIRFWWDSRTFGFQLNELKMFEALDAVLLRSLRSLVCIG